MQRPLRPMRRRLAGAGWLAFAVTLAVPILVLLTSVRLLASERFLRWEYARQGFPAAPGLTAAQRLALAVPATAFVVGQTSRETLAELRRNDRPVFTAPEIAHLMDVRRRLRALEMLAVVGLAVLATGGILWLAGRWPSWPWTIERGGWLTLGLAGLVAAAVGLSWSTFFVRFHEMVFPPGTWQFGADSGLIRLFPERFWYDVAVVLLGLATVGGALAVGCGRGLKRLATRRATRRPGALAG